jgi:NAD(P)-dependent dehydrogenase (short-subunit alcohol dehydrogenase family)
MPESKQVWARHRRAEPRKATRPCTRRPRRVLVPSRAVALVAPAIKAEAGAHLPVKRIGRPEEIADAVLFLMKNGYVNGITLTVDGGGLLV